MTYVNARAPIKVNNRPLITSYDTGDEHSLEHYVYVRSLVKEDDDISPGLSATFAGTAPHLIIRHLNSKSGSLRHKSELRR
jgi:hypothetical protein